ncbi:MAG: PseG/SpsG family protein [Nocardioidaceae bacterium]
MSGQACVLVRCDVGPTLGVGHLMRCLALAEELMERDLAVVFCAEVGSVPWAEEQLARRGIGWVPPVGSAQGHAELARRHDAVLMVIDSYVLAPEVYAAVRSAGTPVLALVDGDLAGREADVYVDQNLGSELLHPPLPEGAVRLAGLDYSLMRDEILEARRGGPQRRPETGVTEVFAFFGGTDAFGAAPEVARALVETGLRFSATVVAGNDATADALTDLPVAEGQRVRVIGPTTRLVEHVQRADVVLSAAGTSTWELMCLGAATGLVCVADNQVLGYERMLAAGAAVGLGTLAEVRGHSGATVRALTTLLSDEATRARLRTEGRRLVDGAGRRRVVDAALRRVGFDTHS